MVNTRNYQKPSPECYKFASRRMIPAGLPLSNCITDRTIAVHSADVLQTGFIPRGRALPVAKPVVPLTTRMLCPAVTETGCDKIDIHLGIRRNVGTSRVS